VEALWHEILGPEFIQVPRQSRIHYRGKYFDYPLKAWNALSGLGLIEAVRCVYSYLHAKARPSPVEENLEQWVSNRFGKRLYNIFFKTYTEKVWGIPCTEIRAEWAAQRIQNLSLAKAILNAASINRRSTQDQVADRPLPVPAPRAGADVGDVRREDHRPGRPGADGAPGGGPRARARPRGRRPGAHAAGRGAHRGRALHLHDARANSRGRPRARRPRRCGARATACATATSWWWP
jgi:hypothetical protein